MARGRLTPQDNQYKLIIGENLTRLGKLRHVKQIDVAHQTGISTSTINGYFNGSRLPTPENVEKLAKFFRVDKSEIDPRFDTEKEEQERTVDLEKDPVVLSYGGKPVSEEDMQIIKAILERHKDEGNN